MSTKLTIKEAVEVIPVSESPPPADCTAIGKLDHSLNQDCAIIYTYLKGVSETPALGFRVFDSYGISTANLVLTLRNCGLNKRMHYNFFSNRRAEVPRFAGVRGSGKQPAFIVEKTGTQT